ncbi:hypothetical protein O181_076225 [Austropuccinia psidii MF-1]|uniref:cyclin-dependent kinase n=1 Tax=Austropuccinia psidii MF-1 TaxID=1389203 RepID=A0A9Q3FFU0_9BASI|nr:hypothetical protein [Austropuccinia psidii MF-1]
MEVVINSPTFQGSSHPTLKDADYPDPSTWIPFKPRLKSSNLDSLHSNWTNIFEIKINESSNHLKELIKKLNSSRNLNLSSNHLIIKIVNFNSVKDRFPHDPQSETNVLSKLDHQNIIPLLGHLDSPIHSNRCIFLPLYPVTLNYILDATNPSLIPSNFKHFQLFVQKVFRNITSGLAYLHSQSIAHRDLSPFNIVLSYDATAVLIDFGTAWDGNPSPDSNHLEFELGTACYRAPELLFGSRSYQPIGLDLWSLGVILAEFFRPFEPIHSYSSPLELSFSNHSAPARSDKIEDDQFSLYDNATSWYSTSFAQFGPSSDLLNQPQMIRKTLFDGNIGDIGLVGSIFKIRGTPNETTWPEARTLPDFSKLEFHQFEPQNLFDLLPFVKSSSSKESDAKLTNTKEDQGLEPANQVIDLIEKLLAYSSNKRLPASEVLKHPWLAQSKLDQAEESRLCAEIMSEWVQ